MTALTAQPRGADAFFDRAYRLAGPRYLDLILGVLVAGVGLFVIPIYASLLIPLYDVPFDQYLGFVLAFEIALLPIGGTAMFLASRRLASPLIDWLAGARDAAHAPSAWTAGVVQTSRWVGWGLAAFWVATFPAAIWTGLELDFPAFGYPTFFLTLTFLVGVAGVFFFLIVDQAIRPVIHEIAERLPRDFTAPRSPQSLERRLTASVPVISFFSMLSIAALGYNSLEPEEYIALMTGGASIVALTFSWVSTVVVRNAVVGRIDDLGKAMRAIDAGDLQTYVPPLAGDEIDELAESLNHVVEGLGERERLREDLRESRARLVAAADAARRRMERDLHDGAQQGLVLSRLRLGQVARGLESNLTATAALAEVRAEIDAAQAELREVAHGLYPSVLESDGLAAALAEAAAHSSIAVTVDAEKVRFPRETEAAVYFCCAEALKNAGEHGGDDVTAAITLATDGGAALRFSVVDTGPGFDVDTADETHGVQNMRDRIGALGGTLEIESHRGAGTTVRGVVPT